jgi:hypothetical protein
MIEYKRTGGFRPPRDREILTIDEQGVFSMWRSVAAAVFPPTAVGRFSGELSPDAAAALKKLAEAAAQAGDLQVLIPPDSAVERVAVSGVALGDDAKASLGIHEEPGGAWGALLERLRQLLADLTAHPQAALKLTADGQTSCLTHVGDQPLQLDLSGLSVRAVLWTGHQNSGDWRYDGPATWENEIVAEPGWSLELPFAHEHKTGASAEVVAYVTLAAYDGRRRVPISLESPRGAS